MNEPKLYQKSQPKDDIPDIDMEEIITFNCKFEGIFEVSKSEEILNEYRELIASFENQIQLFGEIDLNIETIKKIFDIGENEINNCIVRNQGEFYKVSLCYLHQGVNVYQILELKKKEYKFSYKGNNYYCFDMSNMKKYLNNLLKLHDYQIEIPNFLPPNNIVKDIEQFLLLNIPEFKIKIGYQFQDINYETFNYKSLYNNSKEIKGSELNLKLGHYALLSEDDFNKFEYYNTSQRENFFENFLSVALTKKIIGLCGPYGTGKTISLLKMIISVKDQKSLYINLDTVEKLNIIELRKLLNYEILKLFDEKVFEKNNSSRFKKIYNKINNFVNEYDGTNIFHLLIKIIAEVKSLDCYIFFFIIDQYSSKYDSPQNKIESLTMFLETINSNKIHVIICSSMNNDSVKKDFCQCLSVTALNVFCLYKSIFYYYVGSLVRLNTLKKYEKIIEDKSQDFIRYLNYFGNIPIYYYSLNRTQSASRQLEYYVDLEKEKIIKEIKSFYEKKEDIKEDKYYRMLDDIMKIISIINKKEIFFYEKLGDDLLKLPLKYLELKKETIDINDLKLYGLIAKNEKINKFIEELKPSDKFNYEYLISSTQTKFFNEEKYCANYISKITKEEKDKVKFTVIENNFKLNIFYLDYLFPLMEDYLSSIIYEVLLSASKYIYKELPAQTKGGLLEYIISERVKHIKQFGYYKIDNFEIIENFVPNNFFIQNFTSRKTNTIRTFVENKITNIMQKKNLPEGNIFFNQLQFTGKYYDCAVLIQTDKLKEYKLLLLQISKKKILSQRFFREEHMIIMNRVKSKLEKEYDIKIIEGHFSYILTEEEKDQDTIKFCEDNNLNYMLFSIEELKFTKIDYPLFTDKTLITRKFPFQTSFSILPREIFAIENETLIKKDYIQTIQNKLEYEKIESNLYNKLNKIYKTAYDLPDGDANEFAIFGNFKEVFQVNNSFCIWFNNKSKSFYYYNNENHYVKSDFKYSKKLSDENYTLICSKYKIIIN